MSTIKRPGRQDATLARRGRAYDRLPLLPNIIAESVCSRPYTGRELSAQHRDDVHAAEIESLRRAMTPGQVREFADLADARCRAAYVAGAEWFMKCARARDNSGRDQLRDVWIPHWLAAYLDNPDLFRRKCGGGPRRGHNCIADDTRP